MCDAHEKCTILVLWEKSIMCQAHEILTLEHNVVTSPICVLCGAKIYGSQIVGQACFQNETAAWELSA